MNEDEKILRNLETEAKHLAGVIRKMTQSEDFDSQELLELATDLRRIDDLINNILEGQ